MLLAAHVQCAGATAFTNARGDCDFNHPGNWNSGLPGGNAGGDATVNGTAALTSDYDRPYGGFALHIGDGAEGHVTIGPGLTLGPWEDVCVGSRAGGRGILDVAGTLIVAGDAKDLFVGDVLGGYGEVNVTGFLDARKAVEIINGRLTVAAGATQIAPKDEFVIANAGTLVFEIAGTTVSTIGSNPVNNADGVALELGADSTLELHVSGSVSVGQTWTLFERLNTITGVAGGTGTGVFGQVLCPQGYVFEIAYTPAMGNGTVIATLAAIPDTPRVLNPTPADQGTHADPTAPMIWQVQNAVSPTFRISIGTDIACHDVVDSLAIGGDAVYAPAHNLLAYGTIYYWRVDVIDSGRTWPGEVWSFTTGGKADNPAPADGAAFDRTAGRLEWQADDLVDSYDVWFGPPGGLRFVGNVVGTRVTEADLAGAIGTKRVPAGDYLWRVDTRDDQGSVMTTGDIWTVVFPEIKPIVLEDFYGYDGTASLREKWKDGTTGDALGVGGEVWNPGNVAVEHLTSQGVMLLHYEGDPERGQGGFSYHRFDPPLDLVSSGMNVLSMSFHGLETNLPATVTILLATDSMALYAETDDFALAASPWWQTLSMPLGDMSDLPPETLAELQNIRAMAVCVSPDTPEGAGTLYVDDIVLSYVECPSKLKPAADLNGNCTVDLADVVLLAHDWLMSDYVVSAAGDMAGGLVAHYRFDETNGPLASDSSGLGHIAAIATASPDALWRPDGHDGGCIQLDGGTAVELPVAVFAAVDDQLTLSAWVSGDARQYPDSVDAFTFAAGDAAAHRMTWDRLGWALNSGADYGSGWNHFVVVKDAAPGLLRLYHNGRLVAEDRDAFEPVSGLSAGPSVLESTPDTVSQMVVRIDDLRIYSRALKHDEIVYLAAGEAGRVLQNVEPLMTQADIIKNGRIDLADLAAMAGHWLEQR